MAVAGRVFPATKDELWRATVAGVYPFTFQAAAAPEKAPRIISNAIQVRVKDYPRKLLSMKRWR